MVEQSAVDLDRVFRALADRTRRDMLRRLSRRERSVGELAAPLEMSLAAASKHIHVLERAGLIHREIRGRVNVCSLAPQPLAHVSEWVSYYEQFWDGRLDVLEGLLRAEDEAKAQEADGTGKKRDKSLTDNPKGQS